MNYRILLLLTLLTLHAVLKIAHAEGWYCEKVASEWMEKGKILRACGIGNGPDENAARLDAFNNARKEFDVICNKDTTCSNKVINIDPQRSDCQPTGNGVVTCHRLFHYYITEVERKPSTEGDSTTKVETKTITAKVENKTEVHNQIQNVTNNNYVTIKQPVIKEIVRDRRASDGYRSLIKVAGRVSLYSTNSRQYQGVYLTNPTEDEINRAITRGNRSGGMNAIYIYNP
jgi:hypothetical protein